MSNVSTYLDPLTLGKYLDVSFYPRDQESDALSFTSITYPIPSFLPATSEENARRREEYPVQGDQSINSDRAESNSITAT